MALPTIKISNYDYNLEDNRIATFPVEPRDTSKLLVYKNNQISTAVFKNIDAYLPNNAILIYNNSKVIPARLRAVLDSNVAIELFLLEPIMPNDYALSLSNTQTVIWKCLIGNNRKWKTGQLSVSINNIIIQIQRLDKVEDAYYVQFTWDNKDSFANVIDAWGKIPLPPYIKREVVEADKQQYQTTYATHNGSVAAPTAGLHFTPEVLQKIKTKGIASAAVTLHVGAGTFKPVKTEDVAEHIMHAEYFEVDKSIIESLIINENIIAVGTTSMRTLESLYWIGCLIANGQTPEKVWHIQQWLPYTYTGPNFTKTQALQAVIQYLNKSNSKQVQCYTQIIIAPGYNFKLVNHLITNFHQPKSTLLLLISAFMHNEKNTNWRSLYNYALENNYRFLSFGDSSLLSRV
jgi:S-adenosylmethionine:tRNA ribosyltransferase-isomerase